MRRHATEELIRQKAYELWISDGRPGGADQLYWLRAQNDLQLRPSDARQSCEIASPGGPRLRGHIDTMSATHIAGWVWDESRPYQHLDVVILDNDVEIARLVASQFRHDLKHAGIGDGFYAYDYMFPEGFWNGAPHRISIVFPADPTWVCSNPMTAG